MPFLFSYGTLQQEAVQRSTFGRRLGGHPLAFYHTVSFFANGLRLPAETFARPFPPA